MHALVCAESLSHQSVVAHQIHCGLAVQKYDLPVIKFDVSFCPHLLEKLRNLWFERLLDLRELKVFMLALKVRVCFQCIQIGDVGVCLLHLLELCESFLHALDILRELLHAFCLKLVIVINVFGAM
jgi:hypothetical protein